TQLVRGEVQEVCLRPFELGHPVGVRVEASHLSFALRIAKVVDSLPLGQVPGDLAEAAEPTRLVTKRSDDDVGPEPGSILAEAPALFLITAFSFGNLELPVRLAVPNFRGRVEDGEVTADDLGRLVAFDPLRAFVPRDDHARGVEHEDGVIDDTRHEKRELIAEIPRLSGIRLPQHLFDLKDQGRALSIRQVTRSSEPPLPRAPASSARRRQSGGCLRWWKQIRTED